mmetsp:Transcript_5857/g.12996  ORF Transcript_5857/g.12996 Transcript_5857/m.12996 type:complete len:84 (-) Transcript_5857:167-418(-)
MVKLARPRGMDRVRRRVDFAAGKGVPEVRTPLRLACDKPGTSPVCCEVDVVAAARSSDGVVGHMGMDTSACAAEGDGSLAVSA